MGLRLLLRLLLLLRQGAGALFGLGEPERRRLRGERAKEEEEEEVEEVEGLLILSEVS